VKTYIITFVLLSSLASCIPAGKLTEALDENTLLANKYDSLNHKLCDTVINFSTNLNTLKNTLNILNDSILYYRELTLKPLQLTDGDIFLNQMLGISLLSISELHGIKSVSGPSVNNIWLANFKSDLKKYSSEDADVKLNKGFIFINISDKILFKSGSYTLTKKSNQILGTIVKLLQVQPNLSLMIEGHTDSKGFKGTTTMDNWTLSVNRATAVARIFQSKYKINPKRIIAAGRSQYLPIDDNKTMNGRSNNRRIRIVLMPKVSDVMNLNKS
jgi:chemotaxis protein MotB